MSLGGFLPLLQARVEQAEELQDPLLSPRLGQAGVVHHQVRVDLAVMPTDVETTCRCVVFLDDFHSGHEPGERTGRTQVKRKIIILGNRIRYT